MTDDEKPTGNDAGDEQKKRPRKKATTRPDLHAVQGKATTGPRTPHRFAAGNQFGRRTRPLDDPVAAIHTIARDTIASLRFIHIDRTDARGRKRKVRIKAPMDAARGNSIFLGCRLMLDLFAQYEAGALVRQLRQQVADVREELKRVKAQRVAG